jgi:hypothetical protein
MHALRMWKYAWKKKNLSWRRGAARSRMVRMQCCCFIGVLSVSNFVCWCINVCVRVCMYVCIAHMCTQNTKNAVLDLLAGRQVILIMSSTAQDCMRSQTLCVHAYVCVCVYACMHVCMHVSHTCVPNTKNAVLDLLAGRQVILIMSSTAQRALESQT